MAHTKALGSTKLGRDSAAQRLGIKKQHGEAIKPGEIVVRQRGTKYVPGEFVMRGSDDTLYAAKEGTVQYYQKTKTRFDGNKRKATYVKILPVK